MQFGSCPFDASPVEVKEREDGSTLVSCSVCGATWECHNRVLRRVREPDRDAARAARAERQGTQASNPPDHLSAEATWSRVRASIISISHDANGTRSSG